MTVSAASPAHTGRFGLRVRNTVLTVHIVVGATVLRPVLDDDSTADGTALIVGAAYDVAALTAATALAVFKPGRARRQFRPRADRALTAAATNDQ